MATRRSRLQIKPNILGGPKGPSTKPAPKPSTKIANNEELDASKSETGNKVKSPTRITSPRRNVITSPLKEAGSEKVVKDKKTAENEAVGKNDSKSIPEKDSEKIEKEDSKKSDSPNLPARARLRRFGKVNISAARGVKHDSQASKNDENPNQENSTPKSKSESPKATDVENKDESIKEKEDLDKESSDNNSSHSPEKALIQRRSRFPKAKPNIADACRRKQKESAPKEDTTNSSVVDNSAPSIPEITVTDLSANENDTKSSSTKQEITLHSDSSHALTKIQPRLSATPVPIPKSPLKHPTPTIPVSPDKRTRTLSISEPPVVKRQRKPKVDAPTDKPPDRSTMKIRDLIRWNPSSNPMKPKIRNTDCIVSGLEKENIVKKVAVGVGDKIEASVEEAADSALPVPQVTIGPDGNIVINEKSLIVKEQDHGKVSSQEEAVIDETDVFTTYGSFRKRNMSKRWSKKDTKKFYTALAMIGIDFFLISQMFPDRTRLEIKKKFKKEEKVNRALVEKVLKEGIQFDPTVFDNQEKEEGSSEEEEKDEPKKKKGGKRGPKKREGKNSESSQLTPAVRKAVKRKKRSKNYFEDDSTDDEEELLEKKSLRTDDLWKPPSVSQKDGEVVGILMDMSEGRITGEGQGQEGVINVMEVNSEDAYRSDKLIAVPIRNVQKGRGFIPLEPKNDNPSSEVELNLSSSACSRTVRNVPAIPGIQSINIMETNQNTVTGTSAINLPAQNQQQTASHSSKKQIVLPFLNKTSSTMSDTETRQNVNLFNAPMQFNQNSILNNEMETETSHNQLDIGTSQSQLQVGTSQSPEPVGNNDTEETDQYVLVTVVPEDGGETIIHIYRMHGGTHSQNQIMYADPYASQQLTLDSTAINNSIAQSQNLTNTNCIHPNETQLPLTLSKTPLDYTLTPKTRSDVSEMADNSLSESTAQETIDNCSTSMTNANSKVNISDHVIPVMKDDIQLSYEPVSTDLTSQSTFTQLISNEETSVEDSESNLTSTSGNTKPEIYLSNMAPGDDKFRNELEYEVENS